MPREKASSQSPTKHQIALQLQPNKEMVKRRRVTRACDECRKKKVKCDGQQPCIHCTVYSYNCTYNKPTKRAFTQGSQQTFSIGNIPNLEDVQTINNAANSVSPTVINNNHNGNNNISKQNMGSLSPIPNTAIINMNAKNNSHLASANSTPNLKNAGANVMNSASQASIISLNAANFSSPTHNSNSATTPSTNNITNNNLNNIINTNTTSNNNNNNSANNTISSTRKYTTKSSKLQLTINKYQQIFKELLPNMPDINSIDVPTFLQIIRNFKNNSDTFLEDSVKEYHMIINDTTTTTPSQQALQSPKYSSPDNASVQSFNRNNSTTSLDTMMMDQSDNNFSTYTQGIGREIKILLPPKPVALQFVKNTWEHCCVLLRFYHRPTFLKHLEELYETDPSNYTSEQIKFLPLCYSIMAVGALFTKSIEQSNNKDNNAGTTINTINKDGDDKKKGRKNVNENEHLKSSSPLNKNNFMQDEGYKYFIAARKLIDITNTRDLNSIQTVLMLFIFLQCSARLSTCYAYIGVAMRSVLREGFHRKVPENSPLSLIEIECRKRLFFTVYKLDIYVNAMLGLPRSISPEDWDQTFPLDISDDNITDTEIYFERQNGVLSSAGIANQHTKLLFILDSIMRELYPIKRTNNIISHETVTRLEMKLKQWADQLPEELKPNAKSIPVKYERANKLLHLSFLHVQIILYRPFIHFLSRNFVSANTDKLSLQRANNSIVVARTVVRMAQEMVNKNLISGSYWYACYTIFYSVAGLLFYIHEADLPDKDSARKYYEILKDAECGRNVLMQLKDTSMAANRTYNILNKIFEKLNSKTIQLSLMHGSPKNKNVQLNEPPSASTSDVSQTSSYNMDRFVKDVPVLSSYLGQDSTASSRHNTNNIQQNNNVNTINLTTDFADNNMTGNILSNNKPQLEDDNDLFIKTEPEPMTSMFGLSGNQNEIFGVPAPSMTTPTFEPYNNTSPQANSTGTLGMDTNNDKTKTESIDNNVGIFDVFDQLDAQLFGKYNNTSKPQDPVNFENDQGQNTGNN